MNNLKVIFNMDGAGVVIYPDEPIHLDALLVWSVFQEKNSEVDIGRNDNPTDFIIPVGVWNFGDVWGWKTSALFIEGANGETTTFWRKRFRTSQAPGLCAQNPSTVQGAYRGYNSPLPVTLCKKIFAYVAGDKLKILKLLDKIKFVGHKRSIGYGRIVSKEVIEVEDDFSLVREGKAQRFLPDPNGRKFIRPRPPYWNNVDRIKCCSVGDDYVLPS